jgi:hypothetical protein
MMRKSIVAVSVMIFSLLLLAVAYTAPADDVVFSNLKGKSSPGGYVIGLYPSTTNSWALGFPFTPAGRNTRLTEVEVLASLAHGTNDLLITLYTDSSDSPGTPLESWSEVNVLGSAARIVCARSLLHPKLMTGQQYWLVVTMAVPSSEGFWYGNPLSETSTEAGSINGGQWAQSTLLSGAFEIRGREDDEW